MSNVHADMRNMLFLLSFFVVSRDLLCCWVSPHSEQDYPLFHRTVLPYRYPHALHHCNLEILSGIDHPQHQRSSSCYNRGVPLDLVMHMCTVPYTRPRLWVQMIFVARLGVYPLFASMCSGREPSTFGQPWCNRHQNAMLDLTVEQKVRRAVGSDVALASKSLDR